MRMITITESNTVFRMDTISYSCTVETAKVKVHNLLVEFQMTEWAFSSVQACKQLIRFTYCLDCSLMFALSRSPMH